MTKEEYKENLIRMWDSLRIMHKGEKDCAGVDCGDCPFDNDLCNIYEAIEIVENWAKEHPIKTNAEKFKETFGFEPFQNFSTICADANIKCEECQYFNGSACSASTRFWDATYEEPTKE